LLADISGAAAFRHATPAVRHGSFRVIATADRTIAYLRALERSAAVVLVNAGDRPCRLTLEVPELDGRTLQARRWPGRPVGIVADRVSVVDGRADVELAPRDGVVYVAE
jgi:hypothetical protein